MQADKTVLVVEDDFAMRSALAVSLRQMGYPYVTASNGEEAIRLCRERSFSAVMTDMRMPRLGGLDLFHEIKREQIQVPVILMSAFGTIDLAVQAIQEGIFDYLPKPFSGERLRETLERALISSSSFKESEARPVTNDTDRPFLAENPLMIRLLKMAETIAASQATILIEGESGTGKECLARLIHRRSPRAHRPFIAINCAAVPESLLESELFGYEKGAFTGAHAKRLGRFLLAQSGTLVLDEISDMPLALQVKLLRVIQEREIEPLGANKAVPLDIRVIATSNRPLSEEVKAGRFREDLYYRVNGFCLRIPSLRERRSDIPLLVDHFIKKGAIRNRRSPVSMSQQALATLMQQTWRGNVRELETVVERALLLADGGKILEEHLLLEEATPLIAPLSVSSEGVTLWEAERRLILETLERTAGNRTHAAQSLGISIRTLRNKIREYRTDPAVTEGMLSKKTVGTKG